MTDINGKSSRRSFFLHGGAVLGAGVATTAAAAALIPGDSSPASADPQQRPATDDDREAIRRLQLTFTGSMEDQSYEVVAALFSEQAQLNLSGVTAVGRSDIQRLLTDRYRTQQASVLHTAYRHNAAQLKDTLALEDGGRLAAATFHVEVEISTPLPTDSTAAQMARLQGQMALRRWESGRFDGRYVKSLGQWQIASLSYSPIPQTG